MLKLGAIGSLGPARRLRGPRDFMDDGGRRRQLAGWLSLVFSGGSALAPFPICVKN